MVSQADKKVTVKIVSGKLPSVTHEEVMQSPNGGVAQADRRSAMKQIEIRKFGAWQIATAVGAIDDGNFISWAKMGPITGSSPIDEPGEHVWFGHGKTRDEATRKLLKELGLISLAPSEAPAPPENTPPPSQPQPPPQKA